MRAIIFEALSLREISADCSSVESLSSSIFKLNMSTKEVIRAAVMSLQLFDLETWVVANRSFQEIADVSFTTFKEKVMESDLHPILFITRDALEDGEAYQHARQICKLFNVVIDCRKTAAIVAKLLVSLRADLAIYIPESERASVFLYASLTRSVLTQWLQECTLHRSTDPGEQIHPDVISYQEKRQRASGSREFVRTLKHPITSHLSWFREEPRKPIAAFSIFGRLDARRKRILSGVRPIGNWFCPYPGVLKLQALLVSVLKKPVCVCLRNGDFETLQHGIVLLDLYRQELGREYLSESMKHHIEQVRPINLLYEGLLAVLGACTADAKPFLELVSATLQAVRFNFEQYEHVMKTAVAIKPGFIAPSALDAMITKISPQRGGKLTVPEDINILVGSVENAIKHQEDSFMSTGAWGPDFPLTRPSTFLNTNDTEEKESALACSKDYTTQNGFSPGTFSVHCMCSHAKCVAVVCLRQPERCRMPFNFLVQRALKMPSLAVYDHGCGTQKTAIGISLEFVKQTRTVLDAFHFVCHRTCTLAMHPSNYWGLDGCNTESQEQRNGKMKRLQDTLTGFTDKHFMHFVFLTHAYRNLKAMFLDEHDIKPQELNKERWVRWVRDNFSGNFAIFGHNRQQNHLPYAPPPLPGMDFHFSRFFGVTKNRLC